MSEFQSLSLKFFRISFHSLSPSIIRDLPVCLFVSTHFESKNHTLWCAQALLLSFCPLHYKITAKTCLLISTQVISGFCSLIFNLTYLSFYIKFWTYFYWDNVCKTLFQLLYWIYKLMWQKRWYMIHDKAELRNCCM
jgi:hypothetical protein